MKINTKAIFKSALSLCAVVLFGVQASAQCDPPVGPVTFTDIQATSVVANWTVSPSDPSAGGRYEFEVLDAVVGAPGTNAEIVGGFAVNELTNVLVAGLDFSTTYRFYIRYNCSTLPLVSSAWIGPYEFSTATLADPVATPATTVTDNAMRANWNIVPGADSYLFDLSTDNFATFVGVYNDFSTTNNFVDLVGLAPNTLYYYRVRAVGTNGSSTTVTTVYSNTIVRTTTGPATSVYTWVGPYPGQWSPAEGAVDDTKDVIIDFDYDMNIEELESIEAKNLIINPGYTVTVTDGKYVRLIASLNNLNADNEGLIVKSGGNLVQLFNGTNNNLGGMKVERESFPLFRLDYTMWSSPTSGKPGQTSTQTLGDFSPETLPNRFYTYTPATDLFSVIAPTNVFTPGIGYLIRIGNLHPEYAPATLGTSWLGQFEGAINGGEYTVPVSTAGQGFNLIGNPYPSLLSIDNFIIDNPNITGTLYFWRRRNNTTAPGNEATQAFYATYTLAGGVGVPTSDPSDSSGVAPEPYTQPGQGFIVQIEPGGEPSVTFNNSMRAAEVADVPFFRSANTETSRYWLKVSYNQDVYNEMLVAYMPTATNDLDRADGKFIGDATIALTSLVNNEEYVIQGRAPFANTDVVPLYFRTSAAGNFTIAFDRADGIFDADQNIYLRDNVTNVVHDIKAAPYTFAAVAGTFADRFEIIYELPLSVATPTFDANTVVVYKQNGAIQINAGTTVISDVKVFDIRGRVVAQKNNVNASETTVITNAENQVLIIQISSENNGTVTKKFVN